MDFFINEDVVKYEHPDDPSVYVMIKAELSGYEERQRDALADKTTMMMKRNLSETEVKEARKRNQKRIREQEEAKAISDEFEAVVTAVKDELDMFDIVHYVKGWSVSQEPTVENFRKLNRETFNWIITVIDEHRLKTVLKTDGPEGPVNEGDIKNSPQSSPSGKNTVSNLTGKA